MKSRHVIIQTAIIIVVSCSHTARQDQENFDEAMRKGILVQEGYERCLRFVSDWMNYRDSLSGLIPENLSDGRDVWNAHNSAADNYPFMVLTAYLLDKDLYNNEMLDILVSERKLTSRLGALPDEYSFSKQDFARSEIDTNRIIFGTSEYIKDGLIPLTEYIGSSPWSDRMFEMLDELSNYLSVARNIEGSYFGQSVETEINGEMLQTLSRVYWMTGDEKYLNWAIAIADYYLLENPDKILESDRFRLRDHGCEIIGGLSEIYATVSYVNKEKKNDYQSPIHKIFDRILKLGRNADGMFYNEVNMITGEVVNEGIVDNWGYIYNAYYTLYLIDNDTAYREAVMKPFNVLNQKYLNFDWENKSSDGFADAIESGINLYNRERDLGLREWIDSEIKVMWSLQDSAYRETAQEWKNRGVIEGWHGDGNFARTTLMYCLWKTNDVTVVPWEEDLIYGTAIKDGTLYISMKAGANWEGTLLFGKERHKKIFHLPLDYPRINQFPEWYSIEDGDYYLLSKDRKTLKIPGEQLSEGINIKLKKDIPYYIKITKPGL